MTKTLTTERFDRNVTSRDSRFIWTAAAIGRRIGRSDTWVRKVLANAAGTPIRKTETGQLYAEEKSLMTYFRRKVA